MRKRTMFELCECQWGSSVLNTVFLGDICQKGLCFAHVVPTLLSVVFSGDILSRCNGSERCIDDGKELQPVPVTK